MNRHRRRRGYLQLFSFFSNQHAGSRPGLRRQGYPQPKRTCRRERQATTGPGLTSPDPCRTCGPLRLWDGARASKAAYQTSFYWFRRANSHVVIWRHLAQKKKFSTFLGTSRRSTLCIGPTRSPQSPAFATWSLEWHNSTNLHTSYTEVFKCKG